MESFDRLCRDFAKADRENEQFGSPNQVDRAEPTKRVVDSEPLQRRVETKTYFARLNPWVLMWLPIESQ